MELATLRHHFVLIDFNNLSISKDPLVRNVLLTSPQPLPSVALRRVPTPSQPPSDIGGGLIDYGSIRRLRQGFGMAHKLSPFG